MDCSPNSTSFLSSSKLAVSTPKFLSNEFQTCTVTSIQNSSPFSDSSSLQMKTPIRSKRKQLVTRALSREGLCLESPEEHLPAYSSILSVQSLLSSQGFFHNTESSFQQPSIKHFQSLNIPYTPSLRLIDRTSIQSNITQDVEYTPVHLPVDYSVLDSIEGSTPVLYSDSKTPVSPCIAKAQQSMKSFFNELQDSIKDKRIIENKFLLRLADITEKFIELKNDSYMMPVVLELKNDSCMMHAVLELIEETLRGVVQILATEDRLITQEFYSNLQTLNRMLHCNTSQELSSAYLFCSLEKKLLSCEDQIRSAISNLACRGLVELKKLACPEKNTKLLSLAILTLFSEVDCNIDVNLSCKVMSSRAWECMVNYLNKPGEVMQTFRKFTQFVNESKISCSVVKKVNEQFLKLSEEGLKHAEFSHLTIPLYRFLQAALKYYEIYNQIKLHLPPVKKKIMKQPVPRCPSAKKADTRSRPELKSLVRNRSLVKSPQKVKKSSVQNDDKSRSSSTSLISSKSKPFIPKLNIQKALKISNNQKPAFSPIQDKPENPRISSISLSENFDGATHKKEIKMFGKFKPVRSTIKAKLLPKTPKEAKSDPENPYSLRHQYSLSLGEDKSQLFTIADVQFIPNREPHYSDNSKIELTNIFEKNQEFAIQIQIDSKDNPRYLDNTPKFSEGSENKFENIEELEKLTFRDQSFSPFVSEPLTLNNEEFFLDLNIEKESANHGLLSVTSFGCMSLPLVCPVVCTQVNTSYTELSKPVEDLQKLESKHLTVSDAFSEALSQEPECSSDVSSIELDESIRNLIPLGSNVDEFYKNLAMKIMDSNENCTKSSFRKSKVREILRRRGISQDYLKLERSFICEETNVEAIKEIQSENIEQLRTKNKQKPIETLNRIRKTTESISKHSNLKPIKSVQKSNLTKETAKLQDLKRVKDFSPNPRQNTTPKRSRELQSSSEFNCKEQISRSLSKSSLRLKAKSSSKSKENSNKSFSKLDSFHSEAVKTSSAKKRVEYENMMTIAEQMILKEKLKLQGLLNKYNRR